MTGVGSDNALV